MSCQVASAAQAAERHGLQSVMLCSHRFDVYHCSGTQGTTTSKQQQTACHCADLPAFAVSDGMTEEPQQFCEPQQVVQYRSEASQRAE